MQMSTIASPVVIERKRMVHGVVGRSCLNCFQPTGSGQLANCSRDNATLEMTSSRSRETAR